MPAFASFMGTIDAPEVAAAGFAGGPLQRVLDVNMTSQRHTNWCWASVAQAVLRFMHQREVSQDAIATMHMGRTGRNYTCEGARGFEVFENVDCGELGCNAGCNNTHYLRVILGEQGCYHSVLSQEALPTFQQIQHEIDQNRPVPCRVQWVPDTQGGHFILISGWEVGADGARRVHILDPARNDGSNAIVKIKMDYEELEAGYLGTLGYGYINFSYRVA